MVSKDPEAAQPRGQMYATFSRAGRGKGSKGRGRGASCRVGSGAISPWRQGGEWPCFSKRRAENHEIMKSKGNHMMMSVSRTYLSHWMT